MASLGVIVFLVLVAIFAPLLTKIEGQDPTTFHNTPEVICNGQGNVDAQGLPLPGQCVIGIPLPGYEYPSADHWLGVEPVNGRDIFARIVYGARVSLTIALLATFVSVVLGTLIGAAAAFFGGVTDTFFSRFMDLLLAFPVLLLTLTLTPILQDRLGSTFLGHGSTLPIASLVFILGFFGWPYLARIVRGQVLSLREREFVESARSLGASNWRIVSREIIPNVVAVVLVYATLTIPINITAEAALSFLGVGVRTPPRPGGRCSTPPSRATTTRATRGTCWCRACLLVTVLAFNLLGDAVRDALDPRSGRG